MDGPRYPTPGSHGMPRGPGASWLSSSPRQHSGPGFLGTSPRFLSVNNHAPPQTYVRPTIPLAPRSSLEPVAASDRSRASSDAGPQPAAISSGPTSQPVPLAREDLPVQGVNSDGVGRRRDTQLADQALNEQQQRLTAEQGLKTAEARCKTLESRAAELRAQLGVLRSKVELEQEAASAAREDVTTMEAKIPAAQSAVEQAKTELEKQRALRVQTEEATEKLKEKLALLSTEQQKLLAKSERLSETLAQARKEVEESQWLIPGGYSFAAPTGEDGGDVLMSLEGSVRSADEPMSDHSSDVFSISGFSRGSTKSSPGKRRIRRPSAARGRRIGVRELAEIKKIPNPPPSVRLVLEVVCVIFGVKPGKARGSAPGDFDYWEPAKKYLIADPFFLTKLNNFEGLTPSLWRRVSKYFENPLFQGERVKAASRGAFALYSWILEVAEPFRNPIGEENGDES
mmetsp:Transcript_16966/g.37372  ORF Transcript_16966/g.37372 Transcript_16966/m.37372 type:complete len:456 (-) Transcript_16966:12-1379(-)